MMPDDNSNVTARTGRGEGTEAPGDRKGICTGPVVGGGLADTN